MEHAKITLIIAHATIVELVQPVITGDLINKTIGTPLRMVATAANLMEIDKTTIVPVFVLLETTMGLAHTNLTCAHLMISNTTSTNAVATRSSPIRTTIVPKMVGMLSVLIHAHNIKGKDNTEARNGASLITTHRLHAIMIVIRDKLAATTALTGHLVVMIVIGVLLTIRQDLIQRIHAGKAVETDNLTRIHKGHMNILAMRQSRSYSKATTSILIEATRLDLRYRVRINQRSAMSHAYPTGEF
jgi:hypothetical protein